MSHWNKSYCLSCLFWSYSVSVADINHLLNKTISKMLTINFNTQVMSIFHIIIRITRKYPSKNACNLHHLHHQPYASSQYMFINFFSTACTCPCILQCNISLKTKKEPEWIEANCRLILVVSRTAIGFVYIGLPKATKESIIDEYPIYY